jgi:hypothetical protein
MFIIPIGTTLIALVYLALWKSGPKYKSSRMRTPEYTIPLVQVGWGIGYGKTRWYKHQE